jgi:serine acetyltransferase
MEIMPEIPMPAEAALGPGLRIHHFGGIIAYSQAVVREGSTHKHGGNFGRSGRVGGDSPR